MHEMSLMMGIVDQLRKSAAEYHIKKFSIGMLGVGERTLAGPDALQLAFEAFKEEELFQNAVLEIRKEPVRGECKDCHHNFGVEDFAFVCPNCSSPNVRIASGRELYIDYYEGD